MKLMELNELITSTGHTLKRKTANEWAGACPFCGGNDRFIVTPEKDLYWCRQCNKTGDAIQFLMDVKHLTFKEAALQLGRELTSRAWQPLQRKAEAKTTWTPRTTTAPGELWQHAAQAFLEGTQRTLWHDQGKHARAWLHDRGLNDSTIRSAGLGWNTLDPYHDREAWGLAPEANDQGKARNVWTPAGLVIPLIEGGQVIRLRIRRPEPGNGARYVTVTRSAMKPMTLGIEKKNFVIVESELDGLLIHQEAGDVVGVIALGNAQARPDIEAHQALDQAEVILVSLDTDKAGAKEAWQWWAKQYPQARRWPCINGKDPSEAYKNGLDIRAWTLAGLDIRDTVIKPFPAEWKKNFDYDTLERLGVMTVDAGMTDRQALAALTRGTHEQAINNL